MTREDDSWLQILGENIFTIKIIYAWLNSHTAFSITLHWYIYIYIYFILYHTIALTLYSNEKVLVYCFEKGRKVYVSFIYNIQVLIFEILRPFHKILLNEMQLTLPEKNQRIYQFFYTFDSVFFLIRYAILGSDVLEANISWQSPAKETAVKSHHKRLIPKHGWLKSKPQSTHELFALKQNHTTR